MRRARSAGRTGRIGALGLALVVVLTACGGAGGSNAGGTAAGTPREGGTLRVAYGYNPSSLDPYTGNSGADHVVLYPLYDTLVDYTSGDLKPEPGLAESWEQPDPKTLVLHLRQGVTFHDGTPFDAPAVKFNIERGKAAGSNVKADLASVDTVEVVDEHEATLHLNRPDASLLLVLADRPGMMVSPTAYQASGADFARNPVGTGPMKFVSWESGAKVTMARYDGYWDKKKIHLDGLEFSIIPEADTALNALRSGQQDVTLQVQPQAVATLKNDSTLHVDVSPTVLHDIFYLDMSVAPFNNPDVRRAFNLAIDREALLKASYFGLGEVARQPLPSDHWSHSTELDHSYTRDVHQAKALLAKAGYADGLTVSTLLYPTTADVRRGEILKSQLAEAGITLELVPTELTQAVQEFFNQRKYPMFLSSWTGRPDPATTFTLLFSETGYYNAGHAAAPAVDAAVAEANSLSKTDERQKPLAEAAKLVNDQALYVPLVFRPFIVAWSTKVGGYEPNLLGKPKIATMWLSK
jgi:ABC-type transport system substrate-binding protein